MFKQINVRIEGLPIEEAGVEHVLRGIRDSSVVSIYNQVILFLSCSTLIMSRLMTKLFHCVELKIV